MLIGSGMLAAAFAPVCDALPGVWIFAAGVSNSACADPFEFERERRRLTDSLHAGKDASTFVYFGTCGVYDPDSRESAYIRHKVAMEVLVATHPRSLIIRLPQVAGQTPNPHTLLNYLHARISRSERFAIWKHARRNVIDITDAARIVRTLLDQRPEPGLTVNVASLRSHSITEIVAAMEEVTGKTAVLETRDRGGAYDIDTRRIAPVIAVLGIDFGDRYLPAVLGKYYGAGRT